MATITFRPVKDEDLPLLLTLYGSTRAAELAMVPWDEAQRAAFIKHQFDAQTAFYKSEYPDATQSIVLREGEPMGRLYVHRRAHEIRILDFTLLEEPSAAETALPVVSDLQAEAQVAGLPLNIHLEPLNTLQLVFERAGFVKVTSNHTHVLYEWRATPSSD